MSPAPFILLDDARDNDAADARLYRGPVRCVRADRPEQLDPLFATLREALAQGLHAAGYLSYETVLCLESALAALLPEERSTPLAWFGLFEGYETIAPETVTAHLPAPESAWLGRFRPQVTRAEYDRAFADVQSLIAAGDIYQANLTFRALAAFGGDPRALYAAVRPRAKAGYGGMIFDGENWILSFSPELFFSARGGALRTRPMKGTALRSSDEARDNRLARALTADPKQRAENLMIVDLLRNDLSRVAKTGSVKVEDLFAIESYPTVHQMVSTVTARLADRCDAIDALKNLFPCGSITGAPKIRAMEVIAALEPDARGIYCGSIGRLDPNGDAAFNVAIRSFHLPAGANRVSLGLGSGVVADSTLDAEWAECLAKGEFARVETDGFDLVETMGFDPRAGIARLELHLARMKDSARLFDFAFDRHAVRNELQAATFHLGKPAKVRLLLSRSGASAIEIRPAPPAPDHVWRVAIEALPVPPADFRLAHKTSDRAFYDTTREARTDIDEVLFADPDGFLTEGSFTSLFVERDGGMVPPPLSRGLLPGILRQELIDSGQATEGDLTAADLTGGFLLGNSVRGLITAELVK